MNLIANRNGLVLDFAYVCRWEGGDGSAEEMQVIDQPLDDELGYARFTYFQYLSRSLL